MNMEHSCVQLNDLPDEIIMTIFKKLTNVEVLYSLLGVNKRLNRIAHDSIFTNDLRLFRSTSSSYGTVYSLPHEIHHRFCSHILPEIHEKIEWLHLESHSIEDILRAADYPNLYGITFHDMYRRIALDLFTGKIFHFYFIH